MPEQLLPVEYRISFYEPDQARECADFDAVTPFQAVHVGDLVFGVTWKDSAYPLDAKWHNRPAARVTKVAHSLSRVAGKLYNITLVYTASLPDDE